MLRLGERHYHQIVAHVYDGLPFEACGLLVGRAQVAKVEAFVPCRNAAASAKRYTIGPDGWEAADGGTIAEVIDDLETRFPRLRGKLRTDDGSLHKFVNVYVNDEDVRYVDKLDTKVADADVVSILPAVAGG